MPAFVIGISGKRHCGKSTLCRFILNAIKVPTARIAFGDALKLEVHEIFGVPLDWMYNEDKKNKLVPANQRLHRPMTVRELMQWWGTEVRRAEDPLYWVKKTHQAIRAVPLTTVVVCDDLRFPDEANLLKYKCKPSKLIRICPYEGWEARNNVDYNDPKSIDNHSSETALDDYAGFDYKIRPEYGKLEEALDGELMELFDLHLFGEYPYDALTELERKNEQQ